MISDQSKVAATEPAATGRPRYSLRALLVGTIGSATFIGMYTHVWRQAPVVAALFTTSAVAAIGMAVQRSRQKNGLLGAIAGGAIGGITSVALHKVCCEALLLPDEYEHSGLDLAGYTLGFGPPAAIVGIAIGGIVWAATRLFAFLRKLDTQ